jgi:ElaB/YqjD/DUF883 family membrane-anchored ribosome-binding protein
MTTITSSSIGSDPAVSAFDQPIPSGERPNNITATVDRLASGAHQAVDRVAAVANAAAGHLNVKGEDLLAAKDRWAQACSSYVKENPLTALGIAAAVGFLISRWVR